MAPFQSRPLILTDQTLREAQGKARRENLPKLEAAHMIEFTGGY